MISVERALTLHITVVCRVSLLHSYTFTTAQSKSKSAAHHACMYTCLALLRRSLPQAGFSFFIRIIVGSLLGPCVLKGVTNLGFVCLLCSPRLLLIQQFAFLAQTICTLLYQASLLLSHRRLRARTQEDTAEISPVALHPASPDHSSSRHVMLLILAYSECCRPWRLQRHYLLRL